MNRYPGISVELVQSLDDQGFIQSAGTTISTALKNTALPGITVLYTCINITGKRGHIVAHDVSWARKRAGHKMNVVFPCYAETKCF